MSAPHDDHTSGAKDPGVRESGQKVWSIFNYAFIVFILVVGILAIKDTWARWKETAEAKKAEAAEYAAKHPAPVVTSSSTDHCQGPWDVRELDIPAGGLPVQLCWGWSFWPINGPVTLTTKSGKVYKFLPNKEGEIIIPELQMGGMAIFRSDPDDSTRRIAVKNRW